MVPESMSELVQSMSAVGTATFRRSQYAEERGYRIPTALFTRSAGYLTPTQQLSVGRKAWLKPPSTRKDLRRGGVGTYRRGSALPIMPCALAMLAMMAGWLAMVSL